MWHVDSISEASFCASCVRVSKTGFPIDALAPRSFIAPQLINLDPSGAPAPSTALPRSCMRAVQHMLVCFASCVKLAPSHAYTSMPPVRGATAARPRMRRTASPRCVGTRDEEPPTNAVAAAVAAAAAEPEVLFPRLTDDGYSFYDDRFVSSGGSEAWLQNLKGTLGVRPSPSPSLGPNPSPSHQGHLRRLRLMSHAHRVAAEP